MKFAIADKVVLPETAVTQTYGFFGRKGSGKTYAAGVLAESFLSSGVQVVVLDPVGNWFGLRLSKNGKSESPFKIPILGGEHGDIPLQVSGGALVAQTIVDTGTSVVLDVSGFRKGERKRFMSDFAEELFHRKKTNRAPMHLVIEEAQLFAPQMAKGEERMLGAIEDLVRLGRNYGIGCSMISQRPQSINTEVRNQCEPLIVFQLVAHHEREAVGKWMEHMGVNAELAELSRLKTGECFFWSPAWLEKFVRTRFNEKVSFDASSTPTAGSHQRRPGQLKSLDLGELQSAMSATIEEAKANDPKHLKAKITELEKKLLSQTPVADQATIERAVAARDVYWRELIEIMKRDIGVRDEALQKITELAFNICPKSYQYSIKLDPPKPPKMLHPVAKPPAAPHGGIPPRPESNGDFRLSKTQQRIIDAIAWYESIGNPAPSCIKVGAVALIDSTGGYFSNTVGPLASNGLIERSSGCLSLTNTGRSLAAPIEQTATLADYHEVLKNRVRKMKSASNKTVEMLECIISHRGAVTAAEIGLGIGIDHTGGYFSNTIGPLGTAGLITRKAGVVVPTDVLFPDGLS